jgi:hypothetical protein
MARAKAREIIIALSLRSVEFEGGRCSFQEHGMLHIRKLLQATGPHNSYFHMKCGEETSSSQGPLVKTVFGSVRDCWPCRDEFSPPPHMEYRFHSLSNLKLIEIQIWHDYCARGETVRPAAAMVA